jgi:hypothetical protein
MIRSKLPYDETQWRFDFANHFPQLVAHYDHVIYNYKEMSLLRAAWHNNPYEKSRTFLESFKICDAVPWYYLQFVLSTNPKLVIDLGCAINSFKPHIPGLVGVDNDPNSNFDVFDTFDLEFVQGHRQFCDALIAINSIHFAPIDQLRQRLQWCADLVRTGGRGFVTFNIETWLQHTSQDRVEELFGRWPDMDTVLAYVDREIEQSWLKLLVKDWPIMDVSNNSSIRDDLNGNIRLVFQR